MNHAAGGGQLIKRLAAPDDDLLRVLVHEAPFGIAIVDAAARLVRVNAALNCLVAPSCSLQGGTTVMDVLAEATRGEARDKLQAVLTGLLAQVTFVTVVPSKDGASELTVDVSAKALREADGTVSGAILHFSDISVQTRLESQLAHGQKLQAVGQFTSAVAHDFNNLLMAICSAADEVLLRGMLDAESEADLQQIRSAGERGTSLVRHLLAFGKQQPQESQSVAINDVAHNLSRLLQRLLGASIRLDLVIADGVPTAWIDPVLLDQMLMNLMVNARNAMPSGGTITLRTGEAVVTGEVVWEGAPVPPGCYVTMAVEDTGVGIPADVLPHIFDPFFTTRGDQGGSGLGLANVKAILHRCHGFVTVASELGCGTQICLYLPSHARGATPASGVEEGAGVGGIGPARPSGPCSSQPCPGRPRQSAGDRILLVEDDEAVRRLTMRALVGDGWSVTPAESAEAAAALIAGDRALAEDLRLVIADWSLPGQDGVSLVRLVRELRPGLPAILTSGYSVDSVQAAETEKMLYMSKPYTLKGMIAAVQEQVMAAH